MKATLYITLVLVFTATISASTDEPPIRVRQTRGFKNSALATARGFGKRTVLQDFVQTGSTDSAIISNEWLAEQMARNPELAQLIVSKFVDSDGDGHISFRELFPEL